MPDPDPYWFPSKRFGWGWGPPRVWQGWVVLAIFALLVCAGALVVLPSRGPGAFVGYTAFLCVVLVLVCVVKGEPPGRRGGRRRE